MPIYAAIQSSPHSPHPDLRNSILHLLHQRHSDELSGTNFRPLAAGLLAVVSLRCSGYHEHFAPRTQGRETAAVGLFQSSEEFHAHDCPCFSHVFWDSLEMSFNGFKGTNLVLVGNGCPNPADAAAARVTHGDPIWHLQVGTVRSTLPRRSSEWLEGTMTARNSSATPDEKDGIGKHQGRRMRYTIDIWTHRKMIPD